MLPEAAEWGTNVLREVGWEQPGLSVQDSKQNNPVWVWKRECLSHFACHLAGSLSYAGYYTSSERGHSGLSTDVKIWSIVQLIGIIQMCFGVWLLSTHTLQNFGLSLCSHWEQVRPPYRNWKGTSIAFIWGIKASSTKRGCRATKFINLLSNLPSYKSMIHAKLTSTGYPLIITG